MRRSACVCLILAFGLAACSKNSPPPSGVAENKVPNRPSDAAETIRNAVSNSGSGGLSASPGPPMMVGGAGAGAAAQRIGPPAPQPEDPDSQSRYDAALANAMELLSERKFDEALAAFEMANSIITTQTTQLAIERLIKRKDSETYAEQAANNIQVIIDEGKPEEAAKLAGEALRQFENTEVFDKLAALKRQADALLPVQADDRKARFEHFKKEFDEAMKAGNKRGAVVALEQALQNGEDDALKSKLDQLIGDLKRYDQLRERAAAARTDRSQLDEAIAALLEAQKISDTAAVRQEIEEFQALLQDELQFAMRERHERLAVADFEVRGEIGFPMAGAFVADELLPAFKGRYDLVERGQWARIVEELKIEAALGDDADARREAGKAAKVRFLVVGSISAVAGITVQARMVDVETGLIVQTAKIVAQTPEELTQRLPQLARELMMKDQEKEAAEQKRANDVAPVEVLKPEPAAELPPPPEPLKELPAPIIPARPKPPVVNLQPDQFDNIPPPPPVGEMAILPALPAVRELELRRRALFVAIELGDNLFRRGLFRQALVHFEFALSLFPELRPVRRRVEICRVLVPPFIGPPLVARPRVAFLDFLVVGNPAVVPPYLTWWTPENLTPYFAPYYLAVDRSELYWWMGRLGITPFDLLNDPVARLYLGRALNVRYFLFGNLVQTASFNVTTYVVDAEYGFLASGARIHVRNPLELKHRLGELAMLTRMTPEERRRFDNDNAQWILLINEIRMQRERPNKLNDCYKLCQKALRLRPNNVEVLMIMHKVEQEIRGAKFIAVRAALQRPQKSDITADSLLTFMRSVDLARAQAEDQARSADRQRLVAQREAAALRLIAQAEAMSRAKRYASAVSLYESASGLRPNDEAILRELALARARAAETARAELAEAQAAREAQLRREREKELATVRTQLEIERQRRSDADAARRKLLDDRDRAEYDRLMDLAQQLSAKQQYDQAAAAAQKARQLRDTPEAQRLASQLLIDLARASAEKKGAAAKAELEKQLNEEREARAAAEAEAARNRQLYQQLLAQGQQFLKQQKFAEAEEPLLKAQKLFRSDAVLTALQQAQAGKAQAQAQLDAERRKQAELQKQNDLLKQQLADAQTALAAKQNEKAVALFREAKKIAPTNVDVLAGLAKAEQARDQELAAARRVTEDKSKREDFQRLLAAGKANLEGKNYKAAALALAAALKLAPNDKDAKDALAQAEAKLDDGPADGVRRQNELDYQKYIRDGRRFLAAKQYKQALGAFDQAASLVPGDKAAAAFRTETLRLKGEEEKAADAAFRKQAVEKAANIDKAIQRVRAALAAGKLDEATAAYREAVKIDANHPSVVKALADIRKAQDAAAAGSPTDSRFTELVQKARAGLTAKKYDEAAAAITEALKLKPNDAAAKLLEGQISRAREAMVNADAEARYQSAMKSARDAFQARKLDDASRSVAAALEAMPNDKDAVALQSQIEQARKEAAMTAQKRQQFNQLMQQGRTALAAKKFAEALKAFESAQTLFPNDADAAKAVADARKAMDAAKPPMPMGKPAAYARQMEQGVAQEKLGRYDQALVAYKAALRLVPNDADADKKSDFCQFMVDGDKAMKARKFADARTAFESALKLFPNDANAKAALQRAKTAK